MDHLLYFSAHQSCPLEERCPMEQGWTKKDSVNMSLSLQEGKELDNM